MNLEKAIEILKLNIKVAGSKMPPDTLEALKLSVEALKRLNFMRSYNIDQAIMPLPGERK